MSGISCSVELASLTDAAIPFPLPSCSMKLPMNFVHDKLVVAIEFTTKLALLNHKNQPLN